MRSGLFIDYNFKAFIEKFQKKARNLEKDLPKEDFTAYYPKSYVILWLAITFIVAGISFLTSFVSVGVSIFFGILSALFFIAFLYHLTYRAKVNNEGMKIYCLFFFNKTVCWKDVKKVEIRQINLEDNPNEKEVCIRGENNKIIFHCSHELVGFTLIVRMANKYRKKK